jgi:hypothetical protein
MRRLSSACLLLLLCSSLGPVLAQDKKEPAESSKKDSVRPREAEVKFADGSTIKVLIVENVDVVTKYGKLSLPATELRRIEFGLHMTDETARKIEEAINRLGSDTFQKREDAAKELVAFGAVALPALKDAAKSTDQEVALRARTALDRVREKVPAAQLLLKSTDAIQTNEFPIVGRVVNTSLKVRTAYFGELEVKVSDLRGIRWASAPEDEVEVVVDAARYTAEDSWLDTGLTVEAGTALNLTATGQIDLFPQGQPGRFRSGPGGNLQLNQPGSPGKPGALLGKVGENGEIFLVGAKLEKASAPEGKLYLRIVPFNENPASGTYNVKVGGARKAASGD